MGDLEVKQCQSLIEEYLSTRQIPVGKTDSDMWEARKIVDAVVHPVTKEPMFLPGRMSAFVFMNVPIVIMTLNATTASALVASQWLNQSYNVVNNYVNRSSLDVDWSELLKAYGLAVSVSCSIAVAASRAVAACPSLVQFGIFVPYLAVICAGSSNVAFTRMDEWAGQGICVFSDTGEDLGMSLKAGQQAVLRTVATRSVCLPIPLLIVPPIVMKFLPVTGARAKAAQLVIVICCMAFALPCTLALLPRSMELSTASLEPRFQSLTDKSGNAIIKVYANKGL